MSDKMKDFLNKVDTLCFEYGFTIIPTIIDYSDENSDYDTITIEGNGEVEKVCYIDGDGWVQ